MFQKRVAPRVSGLVRMCERVRAEASRGLDAAGRAALAEEIRGAIFAADELCARAGSHPSRLAAPSRNAYRYLRALDPTSLPAGTAGLREPVRASGVVAGVDELLIELAADEGDVESIVERAEALVAKLERACVKRGSTLIELPTRSLRAAFVLRRLAKAKEVTAFRETTVAVATCLREAYSRKWPKDHRITAVAIAAIAPIWRWRGDQREIRFRFSDELVGAPGEILTHLVQWGLGGDRGRGRRQVESWLASSVARSDPSDEVRVGGLVHDLPALFAEVNRDHFNGEMTAPILGWSASPTFHKFGQYTRSNDRVMLSASLDEPGVPRRLVSYVLFHELLHKQLSAEGCHGHSARFRRRERQFPDYDSVVADLNQLSARLRRRQ